MLSTDPTAREGSMLSTHPHCVACSRTCNGICDRRYTNGDPGQQFPASTVGSFANYTVNPLAADGTLLPWIQLDARKDPVVTGSADGKVMSYNFRLCITKVAENRVPFERPRGYDPAEFEVLTRYLANRPELHGLSISDCPGGHRQPGCGTHPVRWLPRTRHQ